MEGANLKAQNPGPAPAEISLKIKKEGVNELLDCTYHLTYSTRLVFNVRDQLQALLTKMRQSTHSCGALFLKQSAPKSTNGALRKTKTVTAKVSVSTSKSKTLGIKVPHCTSLMYLHHLPKRTRTLPWYDSFNLKCTLASAAGAL